MWTIAVYAWRGDTDPPEHLWSAERVHVDVDNGVEWWNNDNKSFINEFTEYDIDIQNKIIMVYKHETSENFNKKSTDDEIFW